LIPGQGTYTGAGLYRSVLEAARRSDGSRHRIVITEAGLTRAYGHPHNPDEGWLNLQEPLDENRYWESLAWYNALLDQDDVMGACLYQVGHRGDWATFRHLGVDNQGRRLRVIDRIVALREALAQQASQPASAPASSPMTAQRVTLSGRVRRNGKALSGAHVRLLGDLTQLGSVRGAVLDAEEPDALPFLWDRTVAGYQGTLRRAWRDLVEGKVAGMDYAAFRRQFIAYNPSITQSGGRLLADQEYLLPRTVGAGQYAMRCTTTTRGHFRFPNIPPGTYTLQVEIAGRLSSSTTISVDRTSHINLMLDDQQ
jgi:hypothetical protein